MVYVDRVEWVILRDAQTQVNALDNGEIDMLEECRSSSTRRCAANPKHRARRREAAGFQFIVRFNHLHPPFNNPKMRQAALLAMNQEAFLRAQMVYQRPLQALHLDLPVRLAVACDKTAYFTGKPQFEAGAEAAQGSRLRRQAGRPHAAHRLHLLNKLPPVMAQLLKQAGFNVDMQAMDWQTLVARRAKKDAPGRAAGTCSSPVGRQRQLEPDATLRR